MKKIKKKTLFFVSLITFIFTFGITVSLNIFLNKQDINYQIVECVVANVDEKYVSNFGVFSGGKFEYDITVLYNGKYYKLLNDKNNSYKYHEGATIKAYLSNNRIYANEDGVRTGTIISTFYFIFLFLTFIELPILILSFIYYKRENSLNNSNNNAGVNNNAVNNISNDEFQRIEKNIKILELENVPYNKDMRLIPSRANTKEPSKDLVYMKLILDFLLATMVTNFPGDVDLDEWNKLYNLLYNGYGIKNFMPKQTEELLEKIKNNSRDVNKNNLSWLYEECAISMWILGLWEFPSQSVQCDVDRMNKILLYNEENSGGYPDLIMKIADMDTKKISLNSLQMKSYEEILEKADLLNRYKWAYDEARIKNLNISFKFDKNVLFSQLKAFYFILDWDPNKSK